MRAETVIRTAGVAALACALVALAAACQPSPEGTSESPRQDVDAMSREHAGDRGTPGPGAALAPSREVVAETLPYAEVDEQLVYGHFVFPADMVDPLPGLIVVHEWWGLNDGVRAMADRLAGEGYIVLAVDLFGGKTAERPPQARQLMQTALENPQLANSNLRQAHDFIRDTGGAPRIGSLGWCFGGAWALNAALLMPEELDAAVIYYGQVVQDEERLVPLEAPVLGLFAEEDRGIPVESVRGFQRALENLGKEHEIEIYPNVGHAFANPSGNNYDPETAELAWERTLSFLEYHLARGT